MRASQRERRVVVIERRASPCRCGVACIASGRESCRGMGGIRRSVPIRLVAAIAGGWQRCVVVIGVARRAGNGCVCARQRECRVVVIKGGWAPAARGVADGAIRREPRSNVIGVRGSSKIRLMAGVACRRRRCVVIVRMALRAGQRRMHPRKWIVSVHRMVEGDQRPVGGRMARVASRGERGCNVIGIRSPRKIGLVAAVARCRQCRVVVVGVALRARDGGMSARKWKHRSMVERGRRPGRCAVA